MKVSILLLTIDRSKLTKHYVGQALERANYPYELCITDNGSTESEIFEWCQAQNPKIYIKNGYNGGTAQSLNKMIELNPSDYYAFIGNDIQLPQDWLKKFVEHAEAIPQSGVIGIDWRGKAKEYDLQTINGKQILVSENAFGTTFISKKVREKVGKFCEDYGVYGLWDSDYHFRCRQAGFINYYLNGLTSHHFGDDVGQDSPYRRMKNESLSKAKPIFDENWKKYQKGDYFL